MADLSEKRTDGHAKRAQQSRDRIVAATLELLAEGNVRPTAEQIAARSGVGRRTVFRHFKDMEKLHQELIVGVAKRLTMLAAPFQSVGWEGKLQEIIDRRSRAFEEFMPFQRAADAHREGSPPIEAARSNRLAIMRSVLESILPQAIKDQKPLLEAIDLALSLSTWEHLRIDQGLCPEDAQEAVATLISCLTAKHRDAQAHAREPF